jgi:hypothetical protein
VVYSRTWVESDPSDTQLAILLGQDIRYLKTDIHERLFVSGPIDSRPTPEAVFVGLVYISTDEAKIYRWNGTSWDEISLVTPAIVPDGARVYNSGVQSIPNAVNTALTFDSERYDNGGLHEGVTNSSRLTAVTAGKYLICGGWCFEARSAGGRYASIRLNGTTILAIRNVYPTALEPFEDAISTVYHLAATDYVELILYQNSGAPLDSLIGASAFPELAMQWLGP